MDPSRPIDPPEAIVHIDEALRNRVWRKDKRPFPE
jgi:hypothetical protein